VSITEKYDRIAQGFAEHDYADPEGYAARRARLIIELAGLRPGQHIIDLCCGDGIMAPPLIAYGVRYTGVDASPGMVEAARARNPGVQFVLGLCEEYEPPEPVEAAICLRGFYYPLDRGAFFRHVASYIRGTFVFDFRPGTYEPEPILDDLRAAGLSEIKLRPFFLPQRRRIPVRAARGVEALERTGPLASLAARRFGTVFCAAGLPAPARIQIGPEEIDGSLATQVARGVEDVERLRPIWSEITWGREEAEIDYFLARVAAKHDATAPLAIVVRRGDRPIAALAARLETRPLETVFGNRVVYAPRLRVLQVVDGGVVASDPAGIEPLVRALRAELADGTADVATIPPLPIGSALYAVFSDGADPLEQQRCLHAWSRRRLVLPSSFDEFLASRTRKIRFGIRYDAKKLLEALGDELSVSVLAEPSDYEQLMRDLELVARLTYQRGAGAGFADTPEQRALMQIGLEHGWIRAFVLYRQKEPIAFWLCAVYGGVILLKTTGFDPAYARHRVGIYLLMRVIEHACDDPTLNVLDFGPGDAEYKRHFSSESHLERNLALYAPTLHARTVNLLRSSILGSARAGRRLSDSVDLTDTIRARWREGLRR
jgi:SAM-dependent methyltransferase